MLIFLSIAWRNVMRNKKRSFITAFAIAFGLAALILMWSLFDGVYPAMIDNMTSMFMGHMEIATPEYIERPALENAVEDGEPLIEAARTHPNVEAYSPRLRVFGLVSYGDNSVGAAIVGIEPELEKNFGRLASDKYIVDGEFISDDDVKGAVIGATLAKNLDVRLNERILFLTQGRYREMAYSLLEVKGIIKTNVPEMDASMLFVRRADLAGSEVLDLPEGITDLAIRVKDQDLLDETQEELQQAVGGKIQVRTWKEIVPWIEQALELDIAFGYIVLAILFIIVVAGILNTVLMSVMERTREFGIMQALGTKGSQIGLVVSLEAIMLGLIGLIFGAIFGTAITLILSQTGIDLYGAMDESFVGQFYMEPIIYPQLSLEHLTINCVIVMIMVILVSLYPARKAAGMQPVEAIKALG